MLFETVFNLQTPKSILACEQNGIEWGSCFWESKIYKKRQFYLTFITSPSFCFKWVLHTEYTNLWIWLVFLIVHIYIIWFGCLTITCVCVRIVCGIVPIFKSSHRSTADTWNLSRMQRNGLSDESKVNNGINCIQWHPSTESTNKRENARLPERKRDL